LPRAGDHHADRRREIIRANLSAVRERVAAAALRAGRSPYDVRIVVVTKDVEVESVRAALELGVLDVGENRVKEGVAKRAALSTDFPAVRWHMIGHLQTNKARKAALEFDLVHSVDGPRVAEALSRAVEEGGRVGPLGVLLQVNVSGEGTKFGVGPGEAEALLREVNRHPGIEVRGLMTIAPLAADAEETRPVFRRLALLARQMRELGLEGVSMDILSMGMSQDYEVAISEGSNLVRIGTAVFGPRGG